MELLGIPGATIVQGGLGAFGLYLLLLVALGRLIPLRRHVEAMQDKQQVIDHMRAAWETECQRAGLQAEQLGEILTFVRQRPRGRP